MNQTDQQGGGIVSLTQLTRNLLASLMGQTFGGSRNLFELFGYEQNVGVEQFRSHYRRGDIAKRIIDAYPDACWKTPPALTTDHDRNSTSPMERTWDKLAKRLRLYHRFNRADKLARIGRYAVILLGLDDGADLSVPAREGNGPDHLLYTQVFGEASASIMSLDKAPTSPRFGKPEYYQIASNDALGISSLRVHHSRVVHVAEGLLENDVYGTPALEAIYNKLQDLLKVVGGGSEIYWRNARGGLHANADKDMDLDAETKEKMKEEVEAFYNALTRVIRTKGFDLNKIEFAFPDPTGIAGVILKLIAGTAGIPLRILLGNEAGELASTQDDDNWNSRVAERQATFCEPMILRATIDRLMGLGVLPEVPEYWVEWPNLMMLSPVQRAEVNLKRAQAIGNYTMEPAALVPPQEFREHFLGLDPEPEGGFEKELQFEEEDV